MAAGININKVEKVYVLWPDGIDDKGEPTRSGIRNLVDINNKPTAGMMWTIVKDRQSGFRNNYIVKDRQGHMTAVPRDLILNESQLEEWKKKVKEQNEMIEADASKWEGGSRKRKSKKHKKSRKKRSRHRKHKN